MSFLDHIRRCNNADLSQFQPWFIGNVRAGFVHRDFARQLPAPLFERHDHAWRLDPTLDTFDKRTRAVRAFLLELRSNGHFADQWREEDYPVNRWFGDPPLMAMERSAVPWFGVRAYGPHLTGYVRKKDGLHVWVPRRSYRKPTFPGELDNTVAGGQPIGLGLLENLIKECQEEAAIPVELARQASAVSCISYWNQSGMQLKPDVMACFDLELPEGFTPHANDGEVEDFELWPMRRVFETVRDTFEFKYNCNLVLIDFFVRHGMLAADDPHYFATIEGLRAAQPPM